MKKKVVFYDLGFHRVTKSSQFMIDLLSEQYDVFHIHDDENIRSAVKKIAVKIHCVIYWQVVNFKVMRLLKCGNAVFFPMYDSAKSKPSLYWNMLRGMQVISFSRALHDLVMSHSGNSLPVQYFPKYSSDCTNPGEAASSTGSIISGVPESPEPTGRSVFFWYRKNEISWNDLRKLAQKNHIKRIHIHVAADPDSSIALPTEKENETYHITYSHWFQTKEEYLARLCGFGYYLSPRKIEGIGFSFLEAMSLGRIVIAYDAPTMSEYIVNGENGYLFSDNCIPSLDRDDEELRGNIEAHIKKGREKWEQDIQEIMRLLARITESDHYRLRYEWICFDLAISVVGIAKKIMSWKEGLK